MGVECEATEIDHNFTDELVCPYCGAIIPDSWEISGDNGSEEDLGEIDCSECEAVFLATRDISITYSSKKME